MLLQRTDCFHKSSFKVIANTHNFSGSFHLCRQRSLEQHVDCLLSYDFSALSKEEILEKLEIVDDQMCIRDSFSVVIRTEITLL